MGLHRPELEVVDTVCESDTPDVARQFLTAYFAKHRGQQSLPGAVVMKARCAEFLIFLGKILPLHQIGFCTYLYRDIFHLSGDPACKSDAGASMQFDRRPMALPYPYRRRLEADHIHFCGRSLHQPTDVRLTTGNDLLKVGFNLDKFWSPSARSIQRLRPVRFHRTAIQPRFL
jgi:hypothetical protein